MLRDIGFLGLGTVGRHMAANLLKGNYNLTVYDSDPEVLGELGNSGQRLLHRRGKQRTGRMWLSDSPREGTPAPGYLRA